MSRESDYRYSNAYRSERHIPNYKRSTYVDGNTVRKYNAEPQRREVAPPQHQRRRKPEVRPVSLPGIDRGSFLFLCCVASVILFVAFSYISTQNRVREMKNDIVSIQSEIADTKESNDAKYQEILASVDLAEVYKKATQKLNMVRAENNQIYTYKNKKSDMVKQYADIPGADD